MTFQGLTIGAGTPYIIQKISGLDAPQARDESLLRPADHGAVSYTSYLNRRTITIEGMVVGNGGPVTALLDSLKQAFAPLSSPADLVFKLPGVDPRRVQAKPLSVTSDWEYQNIGLAASFQVQLVCDDPRIYGTTQYQLVTTLPSAVGGFSFPLKFPLAFGTVQTGGYILANNAGNFETRPVFVLYGPVTNPVITNQTTGETLSFSITLADTDILYVDCYNRLVLIANSSLLQWSSRYSALVSRQWIHLQPGQNTIVYSASTGGANSRLWLVYYDTWI